MYFHVSQCHAWAPGLSTAEQWQAWFRGDYSVDENETPPAKGVPAMLRRRLTRWGRMSLETACVCAAELPEETPILFSSRHGDLQRTLGLLKNLAASEPLSPTAFSLSVHNSSLGIYTIVQQALGPSLATAAGKESLAEALVEAWTLLEEGAERVLLVHTDDLPGDFYQPYADEQDMPLSVALLLHRHQGRRFSLSFAASSEPANDGSMAVAFLRWWFEERESLIYPGSRLTWTWNQENDETAAIQP